MSSKSKQSKSLKQSKSSKLNKTSNLYNKIVLSDKVILDNKDVNSQLINTLQDYIKMKVEGLCINEGFIKPDSVNILSYSSGELFENSIVFQVCYEALVANPVESMVIDCIVKSITKVGIRAEINENVTPFIIFIARDHHYDNELFSKVNENDIISVRIIGQRYELNNKFISVIAELLDINNYETSKTELEGGKMNIKIPKKISKNLK